MKQTNCMKNITAVPLEILFQNSNPDRLVALEKIELCPINGKWSLRVNEKNKWLIKNDKQVLSYCLIEMGEYVNMSNWCYIGFFVNSEKWSNINVVGIEDIKINLSNNLFFQG